jgi:hypothetical protein
VDGTAHVSPVVPGRAWHDDGVPSPLLPDGPELERLRARLARAALDEHASVAAFARTLCQLLALGAPASLVEKTQRAVADEIVHAKESFAWLARLGGGLASPGPLPQAVAPFSGAPDRDAIAEELLRDVFRGGCVGETLAAHEAAEDAARAPTEELRAFHERIADDEARHAALAYETALWLVTEHPRLAAAMREERARFDAAASPSDRACLAPLLAVLDRATR